MFHLSRRYVGAIVSSYGLFVGQHVSASVQTTASQIGCAWRFISSAPALYTSLTPYMCVERKMDTAIDKKPFKCVIMGPPGSGKGTVSERILRHFDMVHISTGDQLRDHIRRETAFGVRAKSFIERGELVPDSLASQIMAVQVANNAHKSWLLDGFPRTVAQAQLLHTLDPVSAIIELNVPFDVIIGRLAHRWIHASSGRIYNLEFNPPKQEGKDDVTGEPLVQRDDDKPETVRARLNNYEKWERPVSDYFMKLNLVHKFSGTTTNEIWPKVFDYLAQNMQTTQAFKSYKK